MNKKKKSNKSGYPDEAIKILARCFYPSMVEFFNSEEGQREFAAWQAEQVHLAGKEKQEVPAGELPAVHIILVCGFWQGASGWTRPVFYYASSFSARSIRYPTPTWVWIRCGASGYRSSFLRRVAINTRREAISFSQLLPQICCVI